MKILNELLLHNAVVLKPQDKKKYIDFMNYLYKNYTIVDFPHKPELLNPHSVLAWNLYHIYHPDSEKIIRAKSDPIIKEYLNTIDYYKTNVIEQKRMTQNNNNYKLTLYNRNIQFQFLNKIKQMNFIENDRTSIDSNPYEHLKNLQGYVSDFQNLMNLFENAKKYNMVQESFFVTTFDYSIFDVNMAKHLDYTGFVKDGLYKERYHAIMQSNHPQRDQYNDFTVYPEVDL